MRATTATPAAMAISRGLPYSKKMRAAPPRPSVPLPAVTASPTDAAPADPPPRFLTRTVYEPLRSQMATWPLPKTRW